MGLVKGKLSSPHPPEQRRKKEEELIKNRAIDELNEKDQREDMQIIKLLLLGAGESGKSTLYKQMISLYGKGWNDKERRKFLETIYSNTGKSNHQ
jgi:hypothetical protein